eukprot:scaffold27118_cov31-Tisochrysis_lutea.AAC.1
MDIEWKETEKPVIFLQERAVGVGPLALGAHGDGGVEASGPMHAARTHAGSLGRRTAPSMASDAAVDRRTGRPADGQIGDASGTSCGRLPLPLGRAPRRADMQLMARVYSASA